MIRLPLFVIAMLTATGAVAAVPIPPSAPVPAIVPDAAPDRAEMRARLAAMDTDHDGRWSKAEWLAGGRRERGFDRLDANHDGFVTTDELRAGMAAMRAARVDDMPLPPPE